MIAFIFTFPLHKISSSHQMILLANLKLKKLHHIIRDTPVLISEGRTLVLKKIKTKYGIDRLDQCAIKNKIE